MMAVWLAWIRPLLNEAAVVACSTPSYPFRLFFDSHDDECSQLRLNYARICRAGVEYHSTVMQPPQLFMAQQTSSRPRK